LAERKKRFTGSLISGKSMLDFSETLS
jgi:hypothetical protein